MKKVGYLSLGIIAALALGLFAQDGPGPEGGGGGGCEPAGGDNEILLSDGAEGCDSDAGFLYNPVTNFLSVTGSAIVTVSLTAVEDLQALDDITAGDDLFATDQMQAARINLTNEFNLNGAAGTSGQVLTSAGDNTLPTWQTLSGVTQETGTFEVTWPTACSTTPSQTWNYTLTGNVVTLLMVDEVNCTSDSTDFLSTAGDVPANLRPTVQQTFWLASMDSGSATSGCLRISTAGTMSVANRAADPMTLCVNSSGSWTASGTKRMRNAADAGVPVSFTYPIN